MAYSIDTPIYINKELVLSLYSILIDGYIESRSIKCVKDRTDNLKLQSCCKGEECLGEKKSNNNKEKNITKDGEQCCSRQLTAGLDDRNTTRNEISIKKIYTTFQIFNNLKEIMTDENIVKNIRGKDILNSNFVCGECLEIKGDILPNSIVSQINTIIDTLDAYDCKNLDKFLNNKKEDTLTNYSFISKQLKNLSNCLIKNNTVNMIIQCNNFKTILNVNLNNFLDKSNYIYDNANCSCTVLCKTIKFANEGEYIDLLCKTCMSDYYNNFVDATNNYIDILERNNILIPGKIVTKIWGPAIQAIPIAMYV
ncbi:DUF6414 family protein [Clostridium rectalis]|uniref:DUF6414 family protein n=1 Tax=Clostridium rectalis TaxID=2040295 RepID=UPI000F63AD7D|nr:hypothetical protein [Clostridium rectalis]